MHSRQELADGFRTLGVSPGDTVMLHASVRAVGDVAGGPDQIHLALKDALTSEGTLIMYASCPTYYDEVGRGHLSADQERELLEKLPAFDAFTARAQRENGVLVEFLRTSPGSTVNPHVARFVVWGKHASVLISGQPWDYAFGHGSVLDRFVTRDGKILLLGCDHDTVTFLHYAEHIVDIPDKRVAKYKVPVDEDGRRVWRDMEEFDTSGAGVHANWPDRFFSRIVDTYLARTNNVGGQVGDAQSFLLVSQGLLEFALPTMQAVARDPADAASLHA
ncbi:MAG: AAC(3) family N-acetyltransferase [Acidobacteria bacterium]|nr:AAC(3) family N-acetyltransferase [Acidobacteriota bacterium]MCA1650853.1 AAC(3) family N-acetyltransferase [Acidobacteriota bacterium]